MATQDIDIFENGGEVKVPDQNVQRLKEALKKEGINRVYEIADSRGIRLPSGIGVDSAADVVVNELLFRAKIPIQKHGDAFTLQKQLPRGINLGLDFNPEQKSGGIRVSGRFQDGGLVEDVDIFSPDERMQGIERNNRKKHPYPEGEDPTAYRWTGEEWVKKSQTGFLGPRIHKPTGATMTEFSIGNINNPLDPDDPLRPSMVSTLTEEEIEFLTTLPEGVSPREWGERPLGRSVLEKSWDHYKMRVEQGLSPFLTHDEESPQPAVQQFQDGGEVISDNQQFIPSQENLQRILDLRAEQGAGMPEIQDAGYLQRIKDYFAQQVQYKIDHEKMIRKSNEEFAPSAGQMANFGATLLPGMAIYEAEKGWPSMPDKDQPLSEAFSGEWGHTMAENLERGGWGGYGSASLQGLGVAGDAMYGIPLIGAVAGPIIGTPLKAASAAGKVISRGIGALSRSNADAALKAIKNVAADKGIKLDIFEKDGVIDLSRIVVPEKGQGVGSEIMHQIIDYADQTGQTIKLTPSKDFGASSVGRLKNFYKKFGFVENKGRNKTFEFIDSMYRAPVASGSFAKGVGSLDDAAIAILEEINLSGGAQIDDMGNVTLYHRTTPAAASKIKETGVMTGREDRLFFSTKPDGEISGYGSDVVKVTIPINKLQLDDTFEDEAHLTLKTDFKPTNVNVISEIDEGVGALPRSNADEISALRAGESLSEATDRLRIAYEAAPSSAKAKKAYLEMRSARDAAGETGGTAVDTGIGSLDVDTSYRMSHQPGPRDPEAIQLDNLSKDISGNQAGYPDDFYSSEGQRLYAQGPRFAGDEYGIANEQSYKAIIGAKGNPEAEVTIYRAVPKGIGTINQGDFVTLSPKYAELHAASGYGRGGDEAGEVISQKVKVKDLLWAGDDVNEFGYAPSNAGQQANIIDEGIGALPRGADEGSSVIDTSSDVASALADQRALKEGIASLDAPALGPEALNKASFIYDDAPPTFKPGSRKLIDAGEELQREALNAWGGKPMAMTDENSLIVANNMTDEARESYRRRPEMAGWYKDNLDRAVKSASEIHPELATDPEALTAFKVIMAITSNGQEVPLNAKLTNQFYTAYKKNGRFLVAGSGKEANAMKKGFENANAIVDDIGFAGFQDFLSREFTVRDLKQAGFNVSGENVDTIVNGSIIFGPKIGGGFMQNLMGNYKPATFDRWWQRTYGRHTGTLIAAPEKVAKQRDAFRAAIGRKRKLVESFGFDIKEVMADDEVLDQFANVVHRKFASGGYKDKSPINNTSRNLGKSLTNLEDAPRGGNQRNFMRKTITQVRDNLRAEGIDIDTADVQALLWYAEKDLYGKMGARVNTTRVDYATVWKEIAAAHAASR